MPREWMSHKKRANGKVPGKKRGKSPDPKGLKKALKTPPPKGAEAASSSGEKPVKRKITFNDSPTVVHVKTEHPPTRKPLSKTDVEKVFAKMIGEGGGDTVENEKAE